jgi:CRP-like cAMP-binding protein
MAGFIDSALEDIENRLRELKEEEQRLLAARVALSGTPARRGPGRPRGSASTTTTTTRRARTTRPRTRGGNTRSKQALDLVRKQPGITIPQIAESLKIQPNYLYRVMPKLTTEGLVRRSGQGWLPAGDGEPSE